MAISISGMRESTFGEMISQYAPDEMHLFDSLRVFIDDTGNFWFIGSEVASIMGYKNPWEAIRDHVPNQYKTNSLANRSAIPTRGNPNFSNTIILVSELGLYSLAIKSNLPQALEFQDWVFRVISRIRQYGGYISPKLTQVVDEIPDYLRPTFNNMIEVKNRVIEKQQNDIAFRNGLINSDHAIIDDQKRQLKQMVSLFQMMLDTVIK